MGEYSKFFSTKFHRRKKGKAIIVLLERKFVLNHVIQLIDNDLVALELKIRVMGS